VSESLQRIAVSLGVDAAKIRVVGNGVDLARFVRLPQDEARRRLGLPAEAKVLISVGGLVERKGFHRVIDLVPGLAQRFPDLVYLVVGGPSPEGDMTDALKRQAAELSVADRVRFTGPIAPKDLAQYLSAADVFVLATRNEGWANVFLEAMACGLPVVTTDVGGNAEVVSRGELGTIVPFGDAEALRAAIVDALERQWDRQAIVTYAADNTWDRRVEVLVGEFERLAAAA
jgi:glycosyltransferase involved in cell wall biosynthesis